MFGQEITNLSYLLNPSSKHLNVNFSFFLSFLTKNLNFHFIFKFESQKLKDTSMETFSKPYIGLEDRENQLQIKKNPHNIIKTTSSFINEKQEKKPSINIEPCDENVKNDPQYVVHYISSIFNELKLQEVFLLKYNKFNKNSMKIQ